MAVDLQRGEFRQFSTLLPFSEKAQETDLSESHVEDSSQSNRQRDCRVVEKREALLVVASCLRIPLLELVASLLEQDGRVV